MATSYEIVGSLGTAEGLTGEAGCRGSLRELPVMWKAYGGGKGLRRCNREPTYRGIAIDCRFRSDSAPSPNDQYFSFTPWHFVCV